jgi:hypothetical protein
MLRSIAKGVMAVTKTEVVVGGVVGLALLAGAAYFSLSRVDARPFGIPAAAPELATTFPVTMVATRPDRSHKTNPESGTSGRPPVTEAACDSDRLKECNQ